MEGRIAGHSGCYHPGSLPSAYFTANKFLTLMSVQVTGCQGNNGTYQEFIQYSDYISTYISGLPGNIVSMIIVHLAQSTLINFPLAYKQKLSCDIYSYEHLIFLALFSLSSNCQYYRFFMRKLLSWSWNLIHEIEYILQNDP